MIYLSEELPSATVIKTEKTLLRQRWRKKTSRLLPIGTRTWLKKCGKKFLTGWNAVVMRGLGKNPCQKNKLSTGTAACSPTRLPRSGWRYRKKLQKKRHHKKTAPLCDAVFFRVEITETQLSYRWPNQPFGSQRVQPECRQPGCHPPPSRFAA
jgi:hypothetical protein